MPWVNVQVNCSFIWNGFQSFEGGKRWWGVVQPPMLECKVFMRTAWQKKGIKHEKMLPSKCWKMRAGRWYYIDGGTNCEQLNAKANDKGNPVTGLTGEQEQHSGTAGRATNLQCQRQRFNPDLLLSVWSLHGL